MESKLISRKSEHDFKYYVNQHYYIKMAPGWVAQSGRAYATLYIL